MKKITITILLFVSLALSGCSQPSSALVEKNSSGTQSNNSSQESTQGNDMPMSSAEIVADKVELYYFHRNARCYSCNTMGELLAGLINDRYSKQVRDGQIEFRQINVELPENKEIADKFKASGSSLFINRISNGQEKIEQDANVWRYLSNEASFSKYLGTKIDSYLGL